MTQSIFARRVAFWPEREAVVLPHRILLLDGSGGVHPIEPWPGQAPGLDTVRAELAGNDACWISPRLGREGEVRGFSLLSGRYVLHGNASTNSDGRKRLWLRRTNGIEFASNHLRARLIANGRQLRHRGIVCLTGHDFHELERSGDHDQSGAFWHGNQYAEAVLAAVPETQTGSSAHAQALLSSEEELVIQTLRGYVDAEFELEEAKARQAAPFVYTELRPEPRPHVHRQFFRMRLVDGAVARIRDEKVGRLRLESDDPRAPVFQVAELHPPNELVASLGTQTPADSLPRTGHLLLDAPPTTKLVRHKVLDRLAEGQHPWLTKAAAAQYQPRAFAPVVAEVPTLNPSQARALRDGLGAQDYLLVLGPPGTGKTTVILEWVKRLVADGKRVLITSQNNKAVDNVLERLAKQPELECVRLGSEGKVMGSVQKLLLDVKARQIQTRLTERIAASSAELGQLAQYLQDVRTQLPQYVHVLRQLEPLDAQIAASTRAIEPLVEREAAAAERVSTHNHEFELHVEQHGLALAHLTQLIALKGLFAWLRRPLVRLRAFLARRRLAGSTRRLETAQATLSAISDRLAAPRAELDALYARRAQTAAGNQPPLPRTEHAGLLRFTFPERVGDVGRAAATLSADLERCARIAAICGRFKASIEGERQEALFPVLLSLVDVVGATCIGIDSRPEFRDVAFDVTIVDEAGQIQLHNLVVPLARSPKAILVGDHKQLRPVVDEALTTELEARQVPLELLTQSWFEKLWDEAPESHRVMLDTQFRCPSVISNYISEAFYDSAYHAGKGMADKRPLFEFAKSPLLFLDTSLTRMRREKTRTLEERVEVLDNPLETELVLEVLERAAKECPELFEDPEGIGVIVPYKNHVEVIRKELVRAVRGGRIPAPSVRVEDMVASVDSFQGQERRLIVFTFSRSNERGSVGFLSDWRRLNVAMTRAKSQLIMIGDRSTLTRVPSNREASDYAFKRAMQLLFEHVAAHGHGLSVER